MNDQSVPKLLRGIMRVTNVPDLSPTAIYESVETCPP